MEDNGLEDGIVGEINANDFDSTNTELHIRSICHRCTAGVQRINDYVVDTDEAVKLAICTQSILAS